MRGGRIQQVGSPHEIYTRPANTFVAQFIGSPQINLVRPDVLGLTWRGERLAGLLFRRGELI